MSFFDYALIAGCLIVAAVVAAEWVDNGYPLYGRDNSLANRKTILPWLWIALLALVVAAV